MCNEVARRIALGELRDDWNETRVPLVFPEGAPNMAPLDSIRITDQTVIVRAGTDGAELVTRRWSWPGTGGRPVYNYRSDGRDLTAGRCLVPVSAFFEYTAPADSKAKRKDRWSVTLADHRWFALAGLWRHTDVGEAFTLLTCPPGPDIAPYHPRQMVVLGRDAWSSWLDPAVPSDTLCQPLPAGRLVIAPAPAA